MLDKGQLLADRYRITAEIARGGMGSVYEAQDEKAGGVVALKESFFQEPELRFAFQHEARLLEHLSHRALPQFFEYFELQGRQCIVMELVPGKDLRRQLREGVKFTTAKTLLWMVELLDVLEYLHGHNIVHRDIKPANLKIGPRHNLMLLDFGLSKGKVGQMTASGLEASTPGYTLSYAAPEQVRREGTTPRSDLYSLGATIYNLLTYTEPADALRREDALVRGLPDPLRHINEFGKGLPRSVGALLMRLMALKEQDRPASALAVRDELERILPTLGRMAHSQSASATGQLQPPQEIAAPETEPAPVLRPVSAPPASVPGPAAVNWHTPVLPAGSGEIPSEPPSTPASGSWPEEVSFPHPVYEGPALPKVVPEPVTQPVAPAQVAAGPPVSQSPEASQPAVAVSAGPTLLGQSGPASGVVSGPVLKIVAGVIVLLLALLGLRSLFSAPSTPGVTNGNQVVPSPTPTPAVSRPPKTVNPKQVDKQKEVKPD